MTVLARNFFIFLLNFQFCFLHDASGSYWDLCATIPFRSIGRVLKERHTLTDFEKK